MTKLRRRLELFLFLAVLTALSACSVRGVDDASAEEVARAAYADAGPPRLTVFTVVNNRTGAGGHSSVMVSGSQRVIFDPAGSFRHEDLTVRGDVLYGVSPGWEQAYKSAHARETYHVVGQTFFVTPEQAETALALVQGYGPVADAFCANATSSVLRQVPGFEDVKTTFYPVKLMEQLDKRPDVVKEKYFEDDQGHVTDGIVAYEG